MRLRIDQAVIAWPSYVDLEVAVRRLLAGQAGTVELNASPFVSLVALRAADGRILLELAAQPAGKRPHYVSCLTHPLEPADLDAAFAMFHDGRLDELSERLLWQAALPRPARRDSGLLPRWIWLVWLGQLFPLLDALFRARRR